MFESMRMDKSFDMVYVWDSIEHDAFFDVRRNVLGKSCSRMKRNIQMKPNELNAVNEFADKKNSISRSILRVQRIAVTR